MILSSKELRLQALPGDALCVDNARAIVIAKSTNNAMLLPTFGAGSYKIEGGHDMFIKWYRLFGHDVMFHHVSAQSSHEFS